MSTKFPQDLTVSGIVLGIQNDSINYTSKKTGLASTLNRDVIILQTSFGVVICRTYNPSVDVSKSFKAGQEAEFPISEYRIDNGLKTATVRI